MPAPRLGEAPRGPGGLPGGGEINGIKMLLDWCLDASGEEHPPLDLVDPDDLLDPPKAAGHLFENTVAGEKEVAVSVALACPQEPAVAEDPQVVGEIDPGGGGFGELRAGGADGRVEAEEVEPLLIARLPLDEDRLGIGGPIDAGHVDVGIGAEVELHRRRLGRGGGVKHEQLDTRVWRSGAGVALLEEARAVGAYSPPWHQLDVALVDPRHHQPRVVGAPPMPLAPVHLLLGDKLRTPPRHRFAAVDRQGALGAGGEFVQEEILIAHERHGRPARRDPGVELRLWRVGEAADGAVGNSGEVEIAIEGDEDRGRVGGPGIRDHAARAADPGPLAAHLLLLGDLPAAELRRVDEHPLHAGSGVEGPQVVAIAVVGPRLEERGELPVGGERQAPRHRAGESGARHDPLEGEGLVRSGRGEYCRGGEADEEGRQSAEIQGAHRLLPTVPTTGWLGCGWG